MNKLKPKVVKDFPNYLIFPDGRLWSLYTKRFIKPFPIGRPQKGVRGYRAYKLCHEGTEFTIQAHRLVAKHFLRQLEGQLEVNHKNGVKDDNCRDNLEWVTREGNRLHAQANGLVPDYKSGEDHFRASFSKEEVLEICRQLEAGKKPLDFVESTPNKLYDKIYRIYKRDNWTTISKDFNW